MINVETARKILGEEESSKLSDKQVLRLLNFLYNISESVINSVLKNSNSVYE